MSYVNPYVKTVWKDESDEYEGRYTETMNGDGTITHVLVRGEVYVEGTPQDAEHFNNEEEGILDAHGGALLILAAMRQLGWRTDDLEKSTVQETGEVTLTNSLQYPFNNSKASVALVNSRDNLNYVVEIVKVEETGGLAGEVIVSERLVNGFKIEFTGSASSVKVTYAVIGGYN